MKGYKLN